MMVIRILIRDQLIGEGEMWIMDKSMIAGLRHCHMYKQKNEPVFGFVNQ